jgi:primosomal protein N' (replication factor Y)
VRVVPDVGALHKTFDYSVPDAMAGAVRVGTQVRVVLAGRRVGAWVIADDVEPPPGVSVRPLSAVRGWGPPPGVLALAQWAAWRWAGPVATFLRTASWDRAARVLPPTSTGTWQRAPTPDVPSWADVVAGRGVSVVRIGPAIDPWPICCAAVTNLRPGDERGVLVLAPARHTVLALAQRLRAEGVPVAVLPDEWPRARAGGCVVVGTRSAAFAPLPGIVAAVVLDAHDEAYHEERAPTWAAWEVVAERARRDGSSCALVSPCPGLDVLAAGPLAVPSRAEERRSWPAVEVVDRRSDDPRTGLFSERLVALMRGARRGPVVCVLNRTGGVRVVACAACGELARCDCGAALELTGAARRATRRAPGTDEGADAVTPVAQFVCRRCGASRPVVCGRCGATRTRALRVGVSRVRQDLEALLGEPVSEIWGSVSGDAGASWERVIVGTEAALHRVPSAEVVAFLDFDAELLAPRYAAGEHALALLVRAARLVAGSPTHPATRAPGRVAVQTRLPRHAAVAAAVSADPGVLAAAEAEMRGALGLPPFRALALVSGPEADTLGRALRLAAPAGVEVNGPSDGAWSVRAPDHRVLCDLLASVPRPPGRVRVEVDPVRA